MNRLFAISFVAVFLAGVSAAPVSAAVVGYWQFDDAAAGTTADSLASQANGLTGTAQANGSGAKPVHAADVPGPLVYDGLLGALLNAANSTSLKFDNAGTVNSHDGGRVSVSDPGGAGSILKPRNFTAEVFYKAEGHVNYPTLFGKNRADTGGASWLLDTSGNDTFRVRVDSQALGLGSGNTGFNQSFTTGINLADGTWHHVAMTYNDATRRVELFVDYVLRGSGTTVNPIVYDNNPLLMGQGAGGRALDGWMDEVRVSGSVLAPDQFLRAGATLEWDGGDADGSNGAGGGSGTWNTDTTANWYPGSGTSDVVWSSATLNNAVFGGTGGTVSISGPVSARSLTFDSAGYTVQNGTLTLTGPWITAHQDATIASTLAGSAGLVKDGAGTLTLTAANAYTGGTTIDEGTIALGHNNALGSGVVTLAGGTLRPNGTRILTNNIQAAAGTSSNLLDNVGTGDLVLTGGLSGSGTVTIDSTLSRSLWFQGDNSGFTGTLNFTNNNNGTNLRLGGSGTGTNNSDNGADFSAAAFVLSGNTTNNRGLSWNGAAGTAVSLGSLSGTGRIGNVLTGSAANWHIGALNTDTTFSGIIEGTNTALTKVGTGTLALTGPLNHTGSTVVNGGMLRLARPSVAFPVAGATGQFASAHTVTVNSGATLQVNANWVLGDGLQNKVVVNGGTLEFLGSDNYLSNIELTGGQIATSGGDRPWRVGNWGSGVITVHPSATSSTIQGALTFVGTAAAPQTVFHVADGPASDDLVVSALIYDHPGFERQMRLVKEGPGRMVLSNSGNTFAGGVTISGGTLSITSLTGGNTASALGAAYGTAPMLVFDGGTLEYTGPTVGGINRAFTINAGGATVDIANAATTVTWTDAAGAGPVVGSGMLTKTGPGTLALTGNNTYTGGTTVHAGTLLVSNTAGSGTGSGAVAVNSGGTLGGTGSIAGTVTINAGGTHAPGASVGSQTVGGETWMPGGRFEFEINDALGQPGGPIGWDELLVNGTLDLTSLSAQDPFHIDIVSLSGTAPGDIDNFVATEPVEWPFLQYETLAGDFSADLFSLDSSQFSNPTGQGYFQVVQMEYEGADWLAIGYVPEPGAWLLLLSALACGLLVRRRK